MPQIIHLEMHPPHSKFTKKVTRLGVAEALPPLDLSESILQWGGTQPKL